MEGLRAWVADGSYRGTVFEDVIDFYREKKMNEEAIIEVKKARVKMDEAIQTIKALPGSAEVTLSLRRAQESVMWLGMALKELGAQNPYPNSYNPANATVEPTADGLKL